MKFFSFLFSVLIALFFLSGCMTSGNKIDKGAVDQIQKGVTTRTEVEAKLGKPMRITLMPEGGRIAWYMFSKSSYDAMMYVPVPFVSVLAGGTNHQQQDLQIIYKNDIVQDYELTESAGHNTGGIINNHEEPVATDQK